MFAIPNKLAKLLQETLSAKHIGQFVKTYEVDYLEESTSVVNYWCQTPEEESTEPVCDLGIVGSVGWSPEESLSQSDASSGAQISAPSKYFKLHNVDVHFPFGKLTLVAGKTGSGKTLLLLALLGEARLLNGKINYAFSPVANPSTNMKSNTWTVARRSVAYAPQVSTAISPK